MRFKHNFLILVVFFVALSMGLSGIGLPSAEAGDKITLTYAFFAPMKSFPGAQMYHWVEELEKRTEGMVMFLFEELLRHSDRCDNRPDLVLITLT